jgi:hypothetical protein
VGSGPPNSDLVADDATGGVLNHFLLGASISGLQGKKNVRGLYHNSGMAFPIRVCAVCSEEFELRPEKPGFANRCPACSETEAADTKTKQSMDADERKTVKEANEARRRAMRDLLYRKDS